MLGLSRVRATECRRSSRRPGKFVSATWCVAIPFLPWLVRIHRSSIESLALSVCADVCAVRAEHSRQHYLQILQEDRGMCRNRTGGRFSEDVKHDHHLLDASRLRPIARGQSDEATFACPSRVHRGRLHRPVSVSSRRGLPASRPSLSHARGGPHGRVERHCSSQRVLYVCRYKFAAVLYENVE
jgi:hypothetical protein